MPPIGMLPLIEQHRSQIEALCRKYGVKRLEVFGSAASGEFNPEHSDVDFFYEFGEGDTADLADRFFALLDDLKRVLGTDVDLVSAKHATNPYFLRAANQH